MNRLVRLSTATSTRRCFSGVSFQLTDDQKAFRDVARTFAREVVKPAAASFDRSGQFPTDIFSQAHALGLVNCHISEKYGGLGLHTLEGCLIAEEIAYGKNSYRTSFLYHGTGLSPRHPVLARLCLSFYGAT